MSADRFFIRDFFAFCKEVLPHEIAEIKSIYVKKLSTES
jgi:hypothetical protein